MFAISVVIFTVLANLLIAVVVFRKNPLSTTNRLVAALSIITALWTVFNFLALSPGSEQDRLFWVRTVMFVTSSYGTVILLLSDVFPGSKHTFSKIKLGVIILINILNYSLAYSPYMFESATNNPDGSFSLSPGWAILIYAIGFMGFMTLGFIKLIKKLKLAQGMLKSQLKIFFTGLVLSFTLLTITNFVAVLVFKSLQLTYLGPPSTLILFAFIIYAIVKHRFLDITSVLARAVSYTFLLGVVVLAEALILWIGTRILPTNVDRTLVAFFGSILIVLGYSSLNTLIIKLTDRIFFQGRYNTEELLKSLISIMVSEVKIDNLTHKLLVMLSSQMRVNDAAFIILKDTGVRSVEFVGFHGKIPLDQTSLESIVKLGDKPLVFEELEDGPTKELFRVNNLSIIIPLGVQTEKIGFLVLGPKSSGDIYTARDLEFLSIFAPQAAIAIKNAESYREIQEFNMTLSGKVAERTRELEASQQAELKLKDEFVFIATHDLATPVTAIAGFSALIEASKSKLPPEIKADLSAIGEASNRLKVLVNDLLQVARSDSGTIKVEPVKVDAGEVLSAAVRQAGPSAKEKKVSIELILDKNNLINADPKKLAEVFENLISNGIKYNREGGKLTVTTLNNDKTLSVQFEDTGLGISKEEQAKVFTKFFRSEEPEVRQRPGTGLGLFVVRMLTEKMGGKISFNSVEGRGTTFYLEFNTAKP